MNFKISSYEFSLPIHDSKLLGLQLIQADTFCIVSRNRLKNKVGIKSGNTTEKLKFLPYYITLNVSNSNQSQRNFCPKLLYLIASNVLISLKEIK